MDEAQEPFEAPESDLPLSGDGSPATSPPAARHEHSDPAALEQSEQSEQSDALARLAGVRAGCSRRPGGGAPAPGWCCPDLGDQGPCLATTALEWASTTDLLVAGAEVLVLVEAADLGLLCSAGVERLLATQTRLAARAAGRTAAAMLALSAHAAAPELALTGLARRGLPELPQPGREPVALACRVSPYTAATRLGEAARLASPSFTVLRELLLVGDTTVGHAFVVRRVLTGLTDTLASAALEEPRVQTSLRADTPGDTARLLARVIAELDPDALVDQEQQADTDRDAWVNSHRPGDPA